MIIIDNILKERERKNNPIKVGIIGVGEMGKGIINQIVKYTSGITIVGVFNRTIENANKAFKEIGIDNYLIVETLSNFQKAVKKGKIAVTNDVDLLCSNEGIDLIIEVTGTVEFAASVIILSINNKKHVLSFNAEVDAVLGPIIKHKANTAGVNYCVADGDQPGVTLNLLRFVKGIGFKPLLCGNIKGLQDHYRNPSTQKDFAKQWGISPEMATNFADGTKISFEQAIIANATGMKVAKRGMYGYYSNEHVDNLTHLYDIDQLKQMGGIVEYLVGAKPGPGVFIYATTNDPLSIRYMNYLKMGKGPLYCFYVPYHLLFFEIAKSISRIIDFNDSVITAKNGLVVDVVAVAKVNLYKDDTIDGIGGYKTYGVCENYSISKDENLLPMGLAQGCKLNKNIPKDQIITYDDITLPRGRLADKLKNEQNNMFL